MRQRPQPLRVPSSEPRVKSESSAGDFLILRAFNSALDGLSDHEKVIIRAKFADPLLHKFFDLQAAEAKDQMLTLDPSQVSQEKAGEFLQAAREARLVWQFWSDFSDFVKDWAE